MESKLYFREVLLIFWQSWNTRISKFRWQHTSINPKSLVKKCTMLLLKPNCNNIAARKYISCCEKCLSFHFEECEMREKIHDTLIDDRNNDAHDLGKWLYDTDVLEISNSYLFEFVEVPSFIVVLWTILMSQSISSKWIFHKYVLH